MCDAKAFFRRQVALLSVSIRSRYRTRLFFSRASRSVPVVWDALSQRWEVSKDSTSAFMTLSFFFAFLLPPPFPFMSAIPFFASSILCLCACMTSDIDRARLRKTSSSSEGNVEPSLPRAQPHTTHDPFLTKLSTVQPGQGHILRSPNLSSSKLAGASAGSPCTPSCCESRIRRCRRQTRIRRSAERRIRV